MAGIRGEGSEEGGLDNFDADIFFEKFFLSDFDNGDSFVEDGLDDVDKGLDEDQYSVRRNQQSKKSKLKKRKFEEIAPDDPRKQIVDVTVSAIGLGDERKIQEVFDQHYTADCQFILRFTKDTPQLPSHREIVGRERMVSFIMNTVESCPDCVLKVIGRQLNIYKDGSSYLVAKMNFSGSWLLSASLNLFEPTTETVGSLNSISASASTSATAFSLSEAVSALAGNLPNGKASKKRINIAVSNVSHINVQGQVYKVDTYMKADIQEDESDSSDDDDIA